MWMWSWRWRWTADLIKIERKKKKQITNFSTHSIRLHRLFFGGFNLKWKKPLFGYSITSRYESFYVRCLSFDTSKICMEIRVNFLLPLAAPQNDPNKTIFCWITSALLPEKIVTYVYIVQWVQHAKKLQVVSHFVSSFDEKLRRQRKRFFLLLWLLLVLLLLLRINKFIMALRFMFEVQVQANAFNFVCVWVKWRTRKLRDIANRGAAKTYFRLLSLGVILSFCHDETCRKLMWNAFLLVEKKWNSFFSLAAK